MRNLTTQKNPLRTLCLVSCRSADFDEMESQPPCRCPVDPRVSAESTSEVLSAACMKTVVACVHIDDHAVASATRLGRVLRPAVTAIWAVSFWNSARPRPCASFPALWKRRTLSRARGASNSFHAANPHGLGCAAKACHAGSKGIVHRLNPQWAQRLTVRYGLGSAALA